MLDSYIQPVPKQDPSERPSILIEKGLESLAPGEGESQSNRAPNPAASIFRPGIMPRCHCARTSQTDTVAAAEMWFVFPIAYRLFLYS